MPDRIIRDELLQSDRWLRLHSVSERLAFFCLLLKADDFGNMEASVWQLARLWQSPLGDCNEEQAAAILARLVEVGLVICYESDEAKEPQFNDKPKHFLHVPRFKQRIRYPRQANPLPPWQKENYVPDVSASEWRTKVRPTIIERDGGRCALCSSDQELTVDHVIPLFKGGLSKPDNLLTLCRSCHNKQARLSTKDIKHLQSLIEKHTTKARDRTTETRVNHDEVKRSEVKRSEEKRSEGLPAPNTSAPTNPHPNPAPLLKNTLAALTSKPKTEAEIESERKRQIDYVTKKTRGTQ